jgi:hypothetical protein
MYQVPMETEPKIALGTGLIALGLLLPRWLIVPERVLDS